MAPCVYPIRGRYLPNAACWFIDRLEQWPVSQRDFNAFALQASMPKDFLAGVLPEYDVVVIGSGLAGMTAANILGRAGHRVLLLEQHYKLGGLATWFKRPGSHTFDISLHGFPYGMIKSCRRYWNEEIASNIVQLKNIRFDNPMFSLTTTFNREDFTRLLVERFGIEERAVTSFFDTARGMNFYDDQRMTTRELFEKFFPGREDVVRLLWSPLPTRMAPLSRTLQSPMGSSFPTSWRKGFLSTKGAPTIWSRRCKRR